MIIDVKRELRRQRADRARHGRRRFPKSFTAYALELLEKKRAGTVIDHEISFLQRNAQKISRELSRNLKKWASPGGPTHQGKE